MADLLIELLPDDSAAFEPEDPEFLALAAENLGNAATESDGHDSIMTNVVLALIEGADHFAADGEEVADIQAAADGIAAIPSSEPLEETQAAATAGDAALDTFDTNLAGGIPTPPAGGGTAGGGGGTGGTRGGGGEGDDCGCGPGQPCIVDVTSGAVLCDPVEFVG